MASGQQMLLYAQEFRETNRRIFRRRAILHFDESRFAHVKTVAISSDHLSLLTQSPIATGQTCFVEFDIMLDKKLLHLRIAGSAIYCVLSGTEGFRIGIQFGQTDATVKKRIEQILTLQAY